MIAFFEMAIAGHRAGVLAKVVASELSPDPGPDGRRLASDFDRGSRVSGLSDMARTTLPTRLPMTFPLGEPGDIPLASRRPSGPGIGAIGQHGQTELARPN